MPSDPSGVSPKGVLTRPAPDFFDDHLAVGGALIIDPTNITETYFSVALFNNSNLGTVFKVYAIDAFANFGGGLALFFVHGLFGTLFGPSNPIRPDAAMPYGQIYTQQAIESGSGLSPWLAGQNIVGHVGTAGESMTHPSRFPYFIVPVGWSLVAANPNSVSGAAASLTCGGAFFWYQVANE